VSAGAHLVTGAGAGIGAAIAGLAARAGHALVLLDRDRDGLEAVAAAARDGGARDVVAHVADVAEEGQVQAAVEAGVAALGPPAAAFSCAGIDRGGPTHELDAGTWDRVLAVNLRGTFLTCRAVLAALVEGNRPGAIVCVSSVLATVATPGGSAAYCASKGGVAALVRSLAVEYAGRGIRVNALAPGATDTRLMWAPVPAGERRSMRAVVEREVPAGRLAEPVEQARAALWLASDEADYVTGAELVVDGGVRARAALSV
jgi:NAD(P)-dependent dehydrogenase (short-subunit alcohol dehydrogenase family)